jgi:hypothetical protein
LVTSITGPPFGWRTTRLRRMVAAVERTSRVGMKK